MTRDRSFATTLMALAQACADRPVGSVPITRIHHRGGHLELKRPGAEPVRVLCAHEPRTAKEQIRGELGWQWAGTDLLALGDAPPWAHGLGWEVYLYDIGHYWWLVQDLRDEMGEVVQVESLWQEAGQFHVGLRSGRGVTSASRPLDGTRFTEALALEMALDHLRELPRQRGDDPGRN